MFKIHAIHLFGYSIYVPLIVIIIAILILLAPFVLSIIANIKILSIDKKLKRLPGEIESRLRAIKE